MIFVTAHNALALRLCLPILYNKTLAWQKEQYAQDPTTKFNGNRLINFLPAWKKEFPWLKDAPSQTLQQAIKNLAKAYQNFFSQLAQFPRFKKKGQQDSFRFPAGFELRPAENRLRLPKLGWMSRKIKFGGKPNFASKRFTPELPTAAAISCIKRQLQLAKTHAIVCIEDLPVRNMSKFAPGNTEQP